MGQHNLLKGPASHGLLLKVRIHHSLRCGEYTKLSHRRAMLLLFFVLGGSAVTNSHPNHRAGIPSAMNTSTALHLLTTSHPHFMVCQYLQRNSLHTKCPSTVREMMGLSLCSCLTPPHLNDGICLLIAARKS